MTEQPHAQPPVDHFFKGLIYTMGIVLIMGSIFLCAVVYQQNNKKPSISKSYPQTTDWALCAASQIDLPVQGQIEKVDISPPYMVLSLKHNGKLALVVVDYCKNHVLKTIQIVPKH